MDFRQLAGLGARAGRAVSGFTSPQEAMGGIQLIKNALMGKAGNVRLGPQGEILYDVSDLDTPAAAMGSFVQTSPTSASDPDVLKHELRHVAQSDLLGPAYLPAAIGETLLTDYGSGALERDAIKTTTPNAEMLRVGSSMNKGSQNPILEALLNKLR
jgi:hypothetical protein